MPSRKICFVVCGDLKKSMEKCILSKAMHDFTKFFFIPKQTHLSISFSTNFLKYLGSCVSFNQVDPFQRKMVSLTYFPSHN